MNGLLGSPIRFRFTGRIFCSNCGNLTKSSFNQGYCFKCMQTLAQCDMCIVKPELCHFHLGTCREPEWGEKHCMIEHTVYLANSSGLKVGITRSHQMRTRWMDQGAIQALPIARVKNRFDSGKVEIALSRHVADKTNWRAMLQGKNPPLDLKAERDKLFAGWGAELPGERLQEEEHRFEYPVLAYPAKLVSLNLDKQPEVAGELQGIKGQYLILSTGVINMRKYGGYELEWELEAAPAAAAEAAPASVAEAAQAPLVPAMDPTADFPPADPAAIDPEPRVPAPALPDPDPGPEQTSLF
jgi:Protein of unknown function (DUF2797)